MSSVRIKHPGALIDILVLQRTGLSQSALARAMGFNQPQPVNELVKGKRNITPKMAIILEQLCDGVYPAEFWLLAQMRWDMAHAQDSLEPSRLGIVEVIKGFDGPEESDAGMVGVLADLAAQLSVIRSQPLIE